MLTCADNSAPFDYWKGNSLLSTAIIILGIAIGIFLLRSIYTTLPEMEDALKKWEIARAMAATNDLSQLLARDHHSSRWGIIIPVVMAIKIFGSNLTSFYIIPLCAYAIIFTFLLYVASKDIDPRLIPVFAVFLFYEPMFFRATAQIQPFVFGVFYLSISLWCMSIYFDKLKLRYLLISALFAFLAYGTKETYLFFVVGLFILLFWKAGTRAVIVYSGILLIFLAIETVVFNSLSGYLTFGRIEFLSGGKHLIRLKQETTGLFDYIFYKWLLLSTFNKVLTIISLGYFVYVFKTKKIHQMHNLTAGVILMALCYTILVTVVPKSLSPLIPIQPPRSKYLTPLMPYYMLICILVLNGILTRVPKPAIKPAMLSCNFVAVIFLIFSLTFESPFKYGIVFYLGKTSHPEKSAMFWKYDDLNKALLTGHGICARRTAKLRITKYFIESYMNESGILDKLQISYMGTYRLLHHRDFDPMTINTFYFHRDLYTKVPASNCFRATQKRIPGMKNINKA